jgi:hypothetical protein
VGNANRDRRRVKLKARERERKRRDHGPERSSATGQSPDQTRAEGPQQAGEGGRTSPAEAVEFLVGAALHAQIEDDKGGLLWCVAQLAGEEGKTASGVPTGDSAVLSGRAAMTAGIPGWQRSVDRKLRRFSCRPSLTTGTVAGSLRNWSGMWSGSSARGTRAWLRTR